MYSDVAATERTDQVNGTIMLSFPKHDILQCEVFNTFFPDRFCELQSGLSKACQRYIVQVKL